MRTIWLKSGLAAALCLLGTSASAQDPGIDEPTTTGLGQGLREMGTSTRGILTDPREYFALSNLTLSGGGAYVNFTEGGTMDLTTGGGSWTVRGVFGMDQPLGIELAYVGAANGVETPLGDNGSVIQSDIDVLLRFGFPFRGERRYILPYATAGIGLNWFSLVDVDAALTGIESSDFVFQLPVGGGIALGQGHWTVDARFLWRPSFGSEMFENAVGVGENSGQAAWSIGGLVGYRF